MIHTHAQQRKLAAGERFFGFRPHSVAWGIAVGLMCLCGKTARRRSPGLALAISLTLALVGSIEALGGQVAVANCTEEALRAALLTAALQGEGQVVFTNDCTITITHQIQINQAVTIDATPYNVVITASNSVPLLEVMANLTLKGLSLVNGSSPATGGAVYIHSNVAVVAERCIFAGNSAVGTNGVAGANGATNANFTGGDGTSGSPGVSGFGGAIYNLGSLALTNCILTNNTATGGNGGNGGNGGAGGGTFEVGGNAGDGAPGGLGLGGAVYNLGDLMLIDCTFSANSAIGGAGGAGGTGGTGNNPGMPGNGGVGGNGSGGAVFNTKNLTLVTSTFSANFAQGGASAAGGMRGNGNGITGPKGAEGSGGALYNSWRAAVTNCTFYTNVAIGGAGGNGGNGGGTFQVPGDGGDGGDGVGGGLVNINTITNVNCTFSSSGAFGGTNGVAGTGNFSGANGQLGAALGGNIAGAGGVMTLMNSIITASVSGPNANGSVVDGGYNLSSDSVPAFGTTSLQNTNPLLGPLASNGGPTPTMALLTTNSPAIGRVPPGAAPNTDQRGAIRPIALYTDIGAFEFGVSPNTISGFVREGTNGLTGVLVNMGASQAATDASGFFSAVVPAGTYSVTPAFPNYSFTPPVLPITVPPAATSLSFAAAPIGSISRTTNDLLQISWPGIAGLTYLVQASTNLANWQSISTNPAPILFTDSVTNLPARFYRIMR
jgi:hypothetical protein